MAQRKRQTRREDAGARDVRATHAEPDEEEYVLGAALQKLRREIEHDTGLRRLEDRGVKYEDEAERKLDHQDEREALLRETHRLNYEIGYAGFRQEYFDDPDVAQEWPDPAAREQGLRAEWDTVAEGSYPSYRQDFSGSSVDVLTAYRDQLAATWAGDKDGQVDYYNRTCAQGRQARLQGDYGQALDDSARRAQHQGQDKSKDRGR